MSSAQQAFTLAVSLFNTGQLERSETLFRQLLQAVPNHPHILLFLGRIATQRGRCSESLAFFDEALRQGSTDPALQLNIGVEFARLGRIENAIQCYRTVLLLAPDSVAAWKNLEACLTEKGEWQEAISCLHQLGSRFPEATNHVSQRIVQVLNSMNLRNREPVPILEFIQAIRHTLFDRPGLTERMHSLCSSGEISQPALAEFNRQTATIELDRIGCIYLAQLWRHLVKLQGYHNSTLHPPLQTQHFLSLTNTDVFDIEFLIVCLDFTLFSPREWNSFLFHHYIAPAISDRLGSGQLGHALFLDMKTAFSFAQQPHTENQAKYCYDTSAPAFTSTGKTILGSWHGLAPLKTQHNGIPVIGFISDLVINGCSPDQVILNLIKSVSACGRRLFDPVIVAFASITDAMRNVLAELGTAVIDLTHIRNKPIYEDDIAQRLLATRSQLLRHGVDVLCYYNTTDGLSNLAASAQLAPVQIYYSMGSFYMDGDHWDGFIGLGPLNQTRKEIDGRIWRTVAYSHPDPFGGPSGQQLIEQGKQLRRDVFGGYWPVLGSIGRPQKIDNDDFMDVLARILSANRSAVFLWFGRAELPSVRERMKVHGVSDRCLFQGFQSVPIYANAIDIHLNSFPTPAGLTMFDTMSAGGAFVSMDTQETRQTGVVKHIEPILRGEACTPEDQTIMRDIFTYKMTGESLFLLARNAANYVEHTQRLIDDPLFRAAAGAANLNFMQRFKFDSAITSMAFAQHIQEVIAEKRLLQRR